MTAYILSAMVAAVAGTLVEMLAPRGEGGRLAAGVRMVAGLFLLVALLSPLRAGLDLLMGLAEGDLDLPEAEAPSYESTLQASLLSMGESELSAWIRDTLSTRFSVPPEASEITPVWDAGTALPPPLAEVRIVLSGEAVWKDPYPIETFFTDALGCPCRVTVDI